MGESPLCPLANDYRFFREVLDADLLHRHAEFRKRVIVEELLHLPAKSHGKLFRSLLRAYLQMGRTPK